MDALNALIISSSIVTLGILWFGVWPLVTTAMYRAACAPIIEELTEVGADGTADVRRAIAAALSDIKAMGNSQDGFVTLLLFIASAHISGITRKDIARACRNSGRSHITRINDRQIQRRVEVLYRTAVRLFMLSLFFRSSLLILGFLIDLLMQGMRSLVMQVARLGERPGAFSIVTVCRQYLNRLQPWAIELVDGNPPTATA